MLHRPSLPAHSSPTRSRAHSSRAHSSQNAHREWANSANRRGARRVTGATAAVLPWVKTAPHPRPRSSRRSGRIRRPQGQSDKSGGHREPPHNLRLGNHFSGTRRDGLSPTWMRMKREWKRRAGHSSEKTAAQDTLLGYAAGAHRDSASRRAAREANQAPHEAQLDLPPPPLLYFVFRSSTYDNLQHHTR
jgi:hypothetical protein